MSQSLKTSLIILSFLIISALGIIGLGETLTPLLISFIFSYLFFPVIKKLEAKNIKRSISVPAIFITFLGSIFIIIALILPGLISDTKVFLNELPSSSAKAFKKIESLSLKAGYEINLSKESISVYIKNHISDFSGGILKGVTKGVKSSFSGIAKWLIAILNIFLIPLFFYYLIHDFEKITNHLNSLIPRSFVPKINHYFNLCNTVLSGYIRGQLMVALILGILYATGLAVVGLKFGVLIGLLSGLISLVPYAGFSIGFLTAIIMALSNYTGLHLIIGVTIVFLTVQALEGMIITPKLVGNKVGLSALSTMLALIIGGNLLGLIGMLIAIPLAAIIKTVINDLIREYQQLPIYKD